MSKQRVTIIKASELRTGDRVHITSGVYKDGETFLTVCRSGYDKRHGYCAYHVLEWDSWQIRFRKSSYVGVVR